MNATSTPLLSKSTRVFFLFFLVICGLYFAKPFLVPVAFGGILAMLFLPISRRLETKGLPRALAALICILLLLLFFAGIGSLLAWQLSDLAGDLNQMEKRITNSISELRTGISNTFGVSPEQQKQMMEKQQSSGSGGLTTVVTGILSSVMGILTNFLIVLIYIFLFLYYRSHLKKFLMKIVPGEKAEAENVLIKASSITQKYLSGLALMIVGLWIMYGIGFSIAGVKNALFFAILCGLLEIVPFVGNITGTSLTVLMAVTQGGGSQMITIIVVTYLLVQFIQSYIIEPLVVGAEVNINPLFTIVGIIVGELIWGIPGMILAIPLLGIFKIVCDHIPPLQPYGFLIGEEKKAGKASGLFAKLKKRFS